MLKELSKRQQRLIKNLKESKTARAKNRCFFVEGVRSVEEVFDSDYDIRFVVLSDSFLGSDDVAAKNKKKSI
jgi:TrmH family RNA methyltransferase